MPFRTPIALPAACLVLVTLGCARPGPFRGADAKPELLSASSADPLLDGSEILVTGTSLHVLGDDSVLVVHGIERFFELPMVERQGAEMRFAVSAEFINAFGEGRHDVDLSVHGSGHETPRLGHELNLASTIDARLVAVPRGNVYRNDVAVLQGDGFVTEGEGMVTARFVGSFTPDEGDVIEIDVELPVTPAEWLSRRRGLVTLTTDIGGPGPGQFDGTIETATTLPSGHYVQSDRVATTLVFGKPVLFSASPTTVTLEQAVTVRGAGFLGGSNRPDEVTLIRLDGEFVEVTGDRRNFSRELVLDFVSGTEMRAVVEAEQHGNRLISRLFESRRGTFTGTATPVVIKGQVEVEGDPIAFSITLVGIRQVVYLRFIPSFYDSLTRFGLATAGGVIEAMVAERIESIYGDWAVDVRLDEPTDYSPNGYSIVEIAGTDPNGIGLFGYDNTPGKDIGNVRLFDAIGGANAETQADNHPGYGGVFIESFLFWSMHPDLPGPVPFNTPASDPLFDEVFDPIRAAPASLDELMGQGDPERAEAVQLALQSLANIIGETASHELGHSLGLADPYGSATTFHNNFAEEGCLMDSGGDRPFGERAGFAGYMPTRLCHDSIEYLDDVLGE